MKHLKASINAGYQPTTQNHSLDFLLFLASFAKSQRFKFLPPLQEGLP
jgi:hypothetical protein